MLYTVYGGNNCHDMALFGYSECLPLSPLLHPGSVISGHKFLEETLSSWPLLLAMQKETHNENKVTSSTSQNLRTEQYPCFGECVNGQWRSQQQPDPFCFMFVTSLPQLYLYRCLCYEVCV
jgi:hypothetical protein